MISQTLLNAMLLPLILAGASCAPDRTLMQPPSQAAGQVQGKPAPLTGKIEIKALPSPCAWMNAPKNFKILSEDSLSITASAKTDLYNDADSGSHTATAPMLLFPAADTFVLTTAVAVNFKQEYDGGFLVVYSDPDHWVKLQNCQRKPLTSSEGMNLAPARSKAKRRSLSDTRMINCVYA